MHVADAADQGAAEVITRATRDRAAVGELAAPGSVPARRPGGEPTARASPHRVDALRLVPPAHAHADAEITTRGRGKSALSAPWIDLRPRQPTTMLTRSRV
jgi:hypothetical protein